MMALHIVGRTGAWSRYTGAELAREARRLARGRGHFVAAHVELNESLRTARLVVEFIPPKSSLTARVSMAI
jgi:hypothetical protein